MIRPSRALLALGGIAAVAFGTLAALSVNEHRTVDAVRSELEQTAGPQAVFSEDMVAGMPDPARRFFLHAIKPGTPLARIARIEMTGEIKPGQQMEWAPFEARQVLTAGRGFLWEVSAQMNGLPVIGADHYLNSQGKMRIALLDLIPVVNATGPDIARAARARAVAELIWWLPSSFFLEKDARVEPVDDRRFAIVYPLDGEESRMTLTVDEEGRLIEGVLPRWGNQTDTGEFTYIPFGGSVEEERTFDGYTIASRATVGWWYGTERYWPFFRVTLDRVLYGD